jgi:site-specific recombinase XerD
MELSPEILQLLQNALTKQSNIKLIDLRDEYISSLQITHSPAYVRTVKTSFNSLIKYAGNVAIIKIDSRLIDKFVTYTFNRSKSAAALYFRTLKAAFSKAVIWGYVSSNQFTKVKLPKFQRPKPAFIKADQLREILVFIPEHLKDIYLFLFLTGLRLGELVSLQWENVNIKDRTLEIGDENFTTKSKQIRVIPICETAADILSKKIPKIYRKDGNYVFPKDSGYHYSVNYLSKKFKAAVRKAGLSEKIRAHSLRHSFASSLVLSGVSIYEIKELLGHRDISTTLIYSHLQISTLKAAVNKLDIAAES